MLLLSIMIAAPVSAQYLLNQTYYNPVSYSNKEENVHFTLRNGGTFEGKRKSILTNGRVTNVSYVGTLTLPSGERYISPEDVGGFDENLNPGSYVCYFSNDGNVYAQSYTNGQLKSSTLITAKYYLNGPYIVFPNSGSNSGGYYNNPSPAPNPGSSSSVTSDYHNPATKRQCTICNGTGKCTHCGGTGNRVVSTFHGNHINPCGVCHSTGTCQTCHGSGKTF